MNKKIVSAVVALGLVITCNASVLAEPLSEKIKNQKQTIQQNKNSLNDVQKKRQNLELTIEKMDNQIESFMQQISNTKKKISKTQKDIKKVEKDIEKAEKDIKAEQELFNKRVRAMYVSGVGSYLDILLESDGLNDLISRVESMKQIMAMDKKIMADLKAKKQSIEEKKQILDNENKKLVELKADNEKKLSEINAKRKEQSKLVQELKEQERKYASKINEAQSYIDAAMREVQQARRSAPKYTPSRGSAPISSNAIVAYASNFLGTPYQWGGDGPSTFDCSGFVKYVYGHFGVNLPRVACEQQGAGSPVSRDNLQAGDLVFFGYPAHHVGIYVGDGCYMHAPRTGDVVKISPLNRSDFSGGVRVR